MLDGCMYDDDDEDYGADAGKAQERGGQILKRLWLQRASSDPCTILHLNRLAAFTLDAARVFFALAQ
jgi:hypothetical protein